MWQQDAWVRPLVWCDGACGTYVEGLVGGNDAGGMVAVLEAAPCAGGDD